MPRSAVLPKLLVLAAGLGALGPLPVARAWEVGNRVVIEHGALTVDHSRTVREITQAQGRGGFPATHGLGLFQSRIKTELTLDAVNPAGPRRLDMTTRITTAPIIYVASEFPKDSCGYGLILAHELLHHQFDLDVLRVMPREIEWISREVFPRDVLERDGPPRPERARSHFFQQFKYRYDELSNPRHQVIDSPEAYRRLSALCNGEIGKRLAATPP